MTALTEILYIIGLFVLRLGIPIAVTLTIAYFLHRLDARWEKEARLQQDAGRVTKEAEKRKSVSVPLPQPAMPIPLALDSYSKPCWELKDCDPVKMADCPAKQDQGNGGQPGRHDRAPTIGETPTIQDQQASAYDQDGQGAQRCSPQSAHTQRILARLRKKGEKRSNIGQSRV